MTPASCQWDELWLRAWDGCLHRVVMQVSGACADWGWPSDCSSSAQTEVTALQACPDRGLNFSLSSPRLCCHDNEYKSIIWLWTIVPQCVAQNCRSFVSEQHSLLKCFQSPFQKLFLCSHSLKCDPHFVLSLSLSLALSCGVQSLWNHLMNVYCFLALLSPCAKLKWWLQF